MSASEFVQSQGTDIVLIGNFNPAIFSPDWFVRQGILKEDELEFVKLEILHPEMARFQVPGLAIEVLDDKFTLHSSAEPFVRAADIVATIFGNTLSHTPLSALGINYHCHARLVDWEQRNRFGRKLAPIEPWGEWGQELESKKITHNGGLLSLVMQNSNLNDREKGNIKTAIQPSVVIDGGSGIYIQVNDHFESLDSGFDSFGTMAAARFMPSIEKARALAYQMIDLARSS